MKVFYPLLLILLSFQLVTTTYIGFATYVGQFNKTYEGNQYQRRKEIYDARVQLFQKITEYTPGINQFSDWTEEELSVYRTLYSLPTQTQSTHQPALVAGSRLGAPAHLDWRDRNVITNIKNQGSCGCCWAFAAVAYAESRLIIEGKYTIDNIDLSQMFLLRCTQLSSCDGGYLEYALESVKSVPTEETYPYKPYSGNSVDCSSNGIRTGYVNKNYYQLSDDQLISLLQVSPVPISISSDGWQNYGSGVYQCDSFARVNHAVLLIGYTPDYWIIKNQWGTNWGENGYIRVTRDSTKNCKIGTSAHTLSALFSLQFIAIMIVLLIFMV